jgi:replicative DNA helicase
VDTTDQIKRFYLEHLPEATVEGGLLKAPCPFCPTDEGEVPGTMVVYLKPESFFFGYFRCLNRCIQGGYHLYFAKIMNIDPQKVPGFDPDREAFVRDVVYPTKNLNAEVKKFVSFMGDEQYAYFRQFGVSDAAADEMKIGYNGRYLVYPYFLEDGNCYAARCILAAREEDNFWHGDETFFFRGIPDL